MKQRQGFLRPDGQCLTDWTCLADYIRCVVVRDSGGKRSDKRGRKEVPGSKLP